VIDGIGGGRVRVTLVRLCGESTGVPERLMNRWGRICVVHGVLGPSNRKLAIRGCETPFDAPRFGAAAGALGAACSWGPTATSTTTSPPVDVGGWTHFADQSPPTDLRIRCTLAPRLAPMARTPTWPTGYQILEAVPGDLIRQFPTVYGGLVAAPAKPGESALQVNSHVIVLETEHDPALETEVRAAYPAGISVASAPMTALVPPVGR